MKKTVACLVLAASSAFSQFHDHDGHMPGERHFNNAGIAVRLVDPDSILITVGARSEDLQNTVRTFPYGDNDEESFRLLELRLEEYFQDRIPVLVDGRRLFLRATQWKPGGKGREDGLDMESLYVDNLFITLGAKLPEQRSRLDITANLWLERRDAGETVVQFSLFHNRTLLQRLWTQREETVRFSLDPDSLAAMRENPPPPLQVAPEANVEHRYENQHDDHEGHDH